MPGSVGVAVGTVAAIGLAAVAAFDVVRGGEDKVRPLEVIVFRGKFRGDWIFSLCWVSVGLWGAARWEGRHMWAQNNVGATGAGLAGNAGGSSGRNLCLFVERIEGTGASIGAESLMS